MSFQKELNSKLLNQREENIKHLEYEKEFGFYKAIAAGDIDEVRKCQKEYNESRGYTTSTQQNGVLSKNPLQNSKFHFVILAAMVTRFCVEAGLERETAYNMSDIYIQKADLCINESQILELMIRMIEDFTLRMRNCQKKSTYSRPIEKCIDYIFDNLHAKIRITDIANHLGMNSSYLSRLFSKEVGTSLSAYIKDKRLEAAAQMLLYSDNSITEISEYFDFSSQSHFTAAFQEKYGKTPKRYRNEQSNKAMPSSGNN